MREFEGQGKGDEDEQPVQRWTKHARGNAHWVPLSGQPSRLSLVGLRAKEKDLGDDLLSQTVASPVPSALTGLTAVFGMGTGVSPPLWSPKSLSRDSREEVHSGNRAGRHAGPSAERRPPSLPPRAEKCDRWSSPRPIS